MSLSTVELFKHIGEKEGLVRVEGDLLVSLQRVLLVMLVDICQFCEENDIEYTLSGGTCLGAYRHMGFIPWDDDIDLNMTRSGYNKFAKCFPRTFPEKYVVTDCQTNNEYELGCPRVRLKGTVLRSREDFDENEEQGVYVDIFILENIPNNPVLQSVHGIISLALGFGLSCRRFAAHREAYAKLFAGKKSAEKILRTKVAIGTLLSFASAHSWCKAWDSWNSLYKNNQSEYLSICAGRKHYYGERYLRADFLPTIVGEFEGFPVMMPHNTSVYLTALYGDTYMEIPPVEERETHVVYAIDLGKYADSKQISGEGKE